MRTFILCICLASALTLSGCGEKVVMTPEFIDPADSVSSEVSDAVSLIPGQVSVGRPDTPPAPPSSEVSDGESSEETSEESSEPAPSFELTAVSSADIIWSDGPVSCTRHTVSYTSEPFPRAGGFTYDYLQLTGDGAEAFNTFWKNDLTEWETSVYGTVLYCAEEAFAKGEEAEYYAIELPAVVLCKGGVISVSRSARQTNGDRVFSFMSNCCFDEATGRKLELWHLFSAPEGVTAPRILEALTIQAQMEGHTGLDAAALFSPDDFALGDGGFIFSLTTETGVIDLMIPYENFADILAYPLLE
ncbi:MAG: hypothetical protein IKM31_06790 [Oscillospiraceae bacterium]|nr:hypothetical protein [Oscillospiraceae bacterium]